jgi:hypothetical protein
MSGQELEDALMAEPRIELAPLCIPCFLERGQNGKEKRNFSFFS